MRLTSCLILVIVVSSQGIFGQVKELKKTIKGASDNGVFVTSFSKPKDKNKTLKWLEKNNYEVLDYEEVTLSRFGDVTSGLEEVKYIHVEEKARRKKARVMELLANIREKQNAIKEHCRLMNDPEIDQYYASLEKASEIKLKLEKLPICSHNYRVEREITSLQGQLKDVEIHRKLFTIYDNKSQIRSYPSYSVIKYKDGWVYFYFFNEKEGFGDYVPDKYAGPFPYVQAYQDFLANDFHAHDRNPVNVNDKEIKLTFPTHIEKSTKNITLKFNLIDGEMYTPDGLRVIQIDLSSKTKVCLQGDCFNGKGILYNPSFKSVKDEIQPILAQGQWENGKLNGSGRIQYMDLQFDRRRASDCELKSFFVDQGSFYEGEFAKGLYHGQGKFRFYRDWLEGMTATYSTEQAGEFVNGKFVGELTKMKYALFQESVRKTWSEFLQVTGLDLSDTGQQSSDYQVLLDSHGDFYISKSEGAGEDWVTVIVSDGGITSSYVNAKTYKVTYIDKYGNTNSTSDPFKDGCFEVSESCSEPPLEVNINYQLEHSKEIKDLKIRFTSGGLYTININ